MACDNCGMAVQPRNGDRIRALRKNWVALVLAGSKTMDMRSQRLKAGKTHLDCKGVIYASATLGNAISIQTTQQWDSLRQHHRVHGNALPCKQCIPKKPKVPHNAISGTQQRPTENTTTPRKHTRQHVQPGLRGTAATRCVHCGTSCCSCTARHHWQQRP